MNNPTPFEIFCAVCSVLGVCAVLFLASAAGLGIFIGIIRFFAGF